MVVVLPEAEATLGAVEESLTDERLAGWLGALRPESVAVGLPRFSFTRALDLVPTLRRMGLVAAFVAGRADFSAMTAEPLFVGAVLHKAFVAVDEAGTEAAAATVVTMRKGMPPPPEIVFVANRPFLFLIRHRPTGCVLFVGRVVDPTKS